MSEMTGTDDAEPLEGRSGRQPTTTDSTSSDYPEEFHAHRPSIAAHRTHPNSNDMRFGTRAQTTPLSD